MQCNRKEVVHLCAIIPKDMIMTQDHPVEEDSNWILPFNLGHMILDTSDHLKVAVVRKH